MFNGGLLWMIQGHTAIMKAASYGFNDIVKLLLLNGAEVNADVSLYLEFMPIKMTVCRP